MHLEKLKTEVRQDSKDLENMIKKLEENAAEKLNLEAQIKNYEIVLAETVRHYFYFSLLLNILYLYCNMLLAWFY